AEVCLRRGAETHARVRLRDQVELLVGGVRSVDHRRVRAEAPGGREQLDWPDAVLGEALLDLARLLARVDVEREALALRRLGGRLEPVARAGAHGVGGDAGADPAVAQG